MNFHPLYQLNADGTLERLDCECIRFEDVLRRIAYYEPQRDENAETMRMLARVALGMEEA